MANNLKYAVALKNAKLDAISTQIGNAGLFRTYDGSQPANPDTAITSQNKLSEHTMGSPFAGSAASGVLTANAIANATAAASGTASWFRATTSGGTAKIDGTVGTASTDCVIDNTSINSGQTVSVTSLALTSGN